MIARDAIVSADGLYRYVLTRTWNLTLPPCVFIGLNPSTADAEEDDATIRRCLRYARDWECGALWMLNLFAWRATDPRDLPEGPEAIGRYNDRHLRGWIHEARRTRGRIIAAWGAAPRAPVRFAEIKDWIGPLECLGITNSGAPLHPVRLRADLLPEPWEYA